MWYIFALAFITCSSGYYHPHMNLMWLHAQGTIFTAECYGHVFMATMNALQLNLLQLVPTDWAEYRTEYNVIAAYYSIVRYSVAPSKRYKWSGVLAQAMHLVAVKDVDVTLQILSDFRSMLQWANSDISNI